MASVPEPLQEFDFYFDFVVSQTERLESLWREEAPAQGSAAKRDQVEPGASVQRAAGGRVLSDSEGRKEAGQGSPAGGKFGDK